MIPFSPLGRFALAAFLAAVLGGCGKPQPKDVPPLARKEAASLASEAVFAAQIRDDARAETLLAKATELDPEQTDTWLELGYARKRQKNDNGARKAYREALAAAERAYNGDAENVSALLDQVFVYALLGDLDAGRELAAKAIKAHPENRALKNFSETQALDRLLADPLFKRHAL